MSIIINNSIELRNQWIKQDVAFADSLRYDNWLYGYALTMLGVGRLEVEKDRLKEGNETPSLNTPVVQIMHAMGL